MDGWLIAAIILLVVGGTIALYGILDSLRLERQRLKRIREELDAIIAKVERYNR